MSNRQWPLGVVALGVAAYAVGMIAYGWRQLIEVFELGDPTGMFGFLMQGGNFLANICAIAVSGLVIVSMRGAVVVPRKVVALVFGSKLLEALSLTPCAFGWGDAFCGFWWVVLSLITAPLVIIVTLSWLFRSGNKMLRRIGLVLTGGAMIAAGATYMMLTPKNPDACMALSGITNRAACLDKFAQRDQDAGLCRKIEFRSTRFSCLYNVARDTATPAICEEIADAPGVAIAAYETPAADTRGLCYYLLGFKLHSEAMCQKVEDEKMRGTCLKNAVSSTQK